MPPYFDFKGATDFLWASLTAALEPAEREALERYESWRERFEQLEEAHDYALPVQATRGFFGYLKGGIHRMWQRDAFGGEDSFASHCGFCVERSDGELTELLEADPSQAEFAAEVRATRDVVTAGIRRVLEANGMAVPFDERERLGILSNAVIETLAAGATARARELVDALLLAGKTPAAERLLAAVVAQEAGSDDA
jgi:hypothetical protein